MAVSEAQPANLQEFVGTWHSSEVVVTCLKASVFLSGAPEVASQAAVEEMLQEAAGLAALRHPNVVCFFGTVLPEQVSRAPQSQLPPCIDGLCVIIPKTVLSVIHNLAQGWSLKLQNADKVSFS